jgi:ABC-2 type transport system permease protein
MLSVICYWLSVVGLKALFLQHMWTLCTKEIRQFFSNLTGYLAILLFLLLNGIFLFVFSSFNILEYGYATLENFFILAPFVLLVLIPATTMRLLTDEWKTGTMETLLTRPISAHAIIIGKYLASLIVILLALIPTLIYPICLELLAENQHALDMGATIGAYLGLVFLCSSFAAISLCISSFTQNSIVAFLTGASACLIFYNGPEIISALPVFRGNIDYMLMQLGMQFHFRSMAKGVLDSRDLLYFISVTALFLFITTKRLEARQKAGK